MTELYRGGYAGHGDRHGDGDLTRDSESAGESLNFNERPGIMIIMIRHGHSGIESGPGSESLARRSRFWVTFFLGPGLGRRGLSAAAGPERPHG